MSTNTTNPPPGDRPPVIAGRTLGLSNGRLWFQVAASAGAWFGLGVADMLITWRACVHEEQFGGASAHPGARILYFAITGILFGVSLLAGGMSYRSWRKLSSVTALLSAEGRERKEFMSLAGLFISFTLGVGIVWLCLPLFIIPMCMRAR